MVLNIKSTLFISIVSLFSTALSAADQNGGVLSKIHQIDMFQLLMIAVVVLVVLVLGYLWYISELLLKTYTRDLQTFKGVEPTTEKRKGFFEKLSINAWNMVPLEKEESIVLQHDYDGIHELDNRLPPWWLYLFYFTIAWGAIYLYVYQWSDLGASQVEVYQEEEEKARYDRIVFLQKQANAVNENNVALVEDEDEMAYAKEIYITNCASCHGPQGQGGVGPNLTDAYWLHGGGIKNIFKTIKYGVPSKGMIAWQEQIQPKTIQSLASYIISLEGSNPPNPKEPQGEIYEEEN